MRTLLFTLTLTLGLPLTPTLAAADGHNCSALRQTVIARAPLTTRNLPYESLSCRSVSLVYSLIVLRNANTSGRLDSRIEAVFRREGLIN